jgi:hypothetical protein
MPSPLRYSPSVANVDSIRMPPGLTFESVCPPFEPGGDSTYLPSRPSPEPDGRRKLVPGDHAAYRSLAHSQYMCDGRFVEQRLRCKRREATDDTT